MVSRFYYFHGQTPENTKVADRGHALHITADNFNKITAHLDRNKLIKETIEKEEARKKALKDGSQQMTKNWNDSIDNIRQRQEEARLRLLGEKDEDRYKTYYQIRKDQEERRQEFIKAVTEKMFTAHGYPREMNMALLRSEVIQEQEMQRQHRKKIQEQEKEDEMKLAQRFKKAAEDEIRENEEKRRKTFERNKKLGDQLKQECEKAAEKLKRDKEIQKAKEAIDNIAAREEMDEIEAVYEAEKIRRMKEIKEDMEISLKNSQLAKEEIKTAEKELDEVVSIYREAKFRLDCMRKRKELELQESLKKRNQIAFENLQKIKEEEQKSIEVGEGNSLEIGNSRKEMRKMVKVQQLKEDKVNYMKKFLEEQELRKKKEKEQYKWEMINRFKTDEITKKRELEIKKKERERNLNYQQELLEQIEDTKRRHLEEEMMNEPPPTDYSMEDNKFLDYADETLAIAKKKGLNTTPIEKVIIEFKKVNNLMEKTDRYCDKLFPDKESKSREIVKKCHEHSKTKKKCKCKRK